MIRSVSMVVVSLILLGGVRFAPVCAQPALVATTNDYGGTMGIPRWKVGISSADPAALWLVFGKASDNFVKSADAGRTWDATDPDALTISSWLDFHVALWQDEQDRLHVVHPAYTDALGFHVSYRRVVPPGETVEQISSPQTLRSRLPSAPSASVVALGSDVFVFTRCGASASENIRYFLSRDGGRTWPTSGYVDQLAYNVRIGAIVHAGQPTLVVWIQELPPSGLSQYRYYRWDGSRFFRPPDSVIAEDRDLRFFSFNVVDSSTLHLVFSNSEGQLDHRWKDWDNGVGTWTRGVVADLGGTTLNHLSAYPHLTVHGADLYCIWSPLIESPSTRSTVWAKWNRTSRTWSAAQPLTASTDNCKQSNAPRFVPGRSASIPVVWTEGTAAPYRVYASTIPVVPQSGPPTRQAVDRKVMAFEEGRSGEAEVLEDSQKYEDGRQ